jgi:hypothetical protein
VTSGEPLFSSINAAKPFGGRAPPGPAGRAHSVPSDPLAGCGGRFAAGGGRKREGRGRKGREGRMGREGKKEMNGREGRGETKEGRKGGKEGRKERKGRMPIFLS